MDYHSLQALARLHAAASSDEGRPVLTGIHLSGDGEHVTGETTDSYVLAQRKVESKALKDDEILVSAHQFNLAARFIKQLHGAGLETLKISIATGTPRKLKIVR